MCFTDYFVYRFSSEYKHVWPSLVKMLNFMCLIDYFIYKFRLNDWPQQK